MNEPGDGRALAIMLGGLGLLCLALYGWSAWARVDFVDSPWSGAVLVAFIAATTAVGLWKPLWIVWLVFFSVPLFGNHPGGRWMELINIPVAAGLIGLAVAARRLERPPPGGLMWIAGAAYVLSAAFASIAAMPGIMIRWAEIGRASEAIAGALTAPENDPLYSIGSLLMLALAVAWAGAIWWLAPGVRFVRASLWAIAAGLLMSVVLGALDLHGVVQLIAFYQYRIDPRSYDPGTFQSLFWNPGWFAWYFTMAFGTTVGLAMTERAARRWVIAVALTVSYVYFLANPQRGGFVALNLSLLVVGAALLSASAAYRRWRKVTVIAGLVILGTVAVLGAMDKVNLRGPWLSAVRRLSTSDPLVAESNQVRTRLYRAALAMWQSAPVGGIGEGAFSWRFRQFVPRGSANDTRTSGDAHNTWLQILATRGLVGLVAYAALLAALVRSTFWILKTFRPRAQLSGTDDEDERITYGAGVGISVALLSFFVYSFVQAMFYLQSIQLLFWGLVAMVGVLSNRQSAIGNRQSAITGFLRQHRHETIVVIAALFVLQTWSYRPMFYQAIERVARERPALQWVTRWLPDSVTVDESYGFLGWETEADGRPFRWIDSVATFPVPAEAEAVDIPLRTLSARGKPVEVSIALDGREVNRVRLSDENWIHVRQLLHPHNRGVRDQRIQLRVHGSWSPVKVGEIQVRRSQ